MKKNLTAIFAMILLAQYSWGQCPLTVNAYEDVSICEGGQVQLSVNVPGVTYSWGPSSTLSNASVANPIATPTKTTAYYVKVTDANGCSGTDTVVVNVILRPTVYAGRDTTYCFENTGNSIPLFGNAADADSISWRRIMEVGGNFSDRMSTSPIFSPLEDDVSTNFAFVMEGFSFPGCYSSDTVTIKRHLYPSVNAGADQNLEDTSVVFLAGTANNTSDISWSSTGSGIFVPNAQTLTAMYQASQADLVQGQVSFVLNAKYIPGCPGSSDTMLAKIATGLSISGAVKKNEIEINGEVLLFQLQNQRYELLATKFIYGSVNYSFHGLSNGTYLVLSHPSSADFIPTYYGGDTSWIAADPIIINNTSATNINITPVSFTSADPKVFEGVDVIAGKVTEETLDNVRTSGIRLVANATVFLLNTQGKVLAFTYTNLIGNFSFPNLVEGVYSLKVEYPGARIELASAEVDGDQNTTTETNFSIKKEVVTGLNAGSIPHESFMKVYPNPVKEILYLKSEVGSCLMSIYDLSGRLMSQAQLEGANETLNVQNLPNGIYVAEFRSATNIVKHKFTKI